MITTTISGTFTVVIDDLTKYTTTLAMYSTTAGVSNLIGNESTLTITFDYNATTTE